MAGGEQGDGLVAHLAVGQRTFAAVIILKPGRQQQGQQVVSAVRRLPALGNQVVDNAVEARAGAFELQAVRKREAMQKIA